MNTQSSAMNESSIPSQGTAPAAVSPLQAIYWSIRRELWENRCALHRAAHRRSRLSVRLRNQPGNYAAPPRRRIAARNLRHHLGASPLGPDRPHDLLASRYELAASLIMGTAFIVGNFLLARRAARRAPRSQHPLLEVAAGLRSDHRTLEAGHSPGGSATSQFRHHPGNAIHHARAEHVMLLGNGANIAALWTQLSFAKCLWCCFIAFSQFTVCITRQSTAGC